MVVSVIPDASLVSIAQNLLGFHAGTDFRSSNVSVINDCISPAAVLGGFQAISAGVPPPPAVRLRKLSAPMTLSRKMRRAKRRHRSEDRGGDWEELGDGSGGEGDDGSYGNGKDGGGGGGWSFGTGDGASNTDPAFDFVYEVISWLALSQCLQFAFKRFVRFLEDRDKVPAFALTDLFTFRTSTARVAN